MTRARFPSHVLARAEAGAAEYGDRSFGRPVVELLAELNEELADVAGWAHVAQHAASRQGRGPSVRPDLHTVLRFVSAEAWRLYDLLERVAAAERRAEPGPPDEPLDALPFLREVAIEAAAGRAPKCPVCRSRRPPRDCVCAGRGHLSCDGAGDVYAGTVHRQPRVDAKTQGAHR